MPGSRARPSGSCTSGRATAVEAPRARLRCAVGRRLLDPRHSALRRRAPAARGASGTTSCCIPLVDLTTTLDPYFNIAYRFGAIFLSEAAPGGPGRPDQAVALLAKGIAAQPDKWQYPHDIAFVYYWHLRDFETAAQWFERAASYPNAPNWLKPLAASVLGGGQRSRVRAVPVEPDTPVRGGVAAEDRRAQPQRSSTRSMRSISCRPSSSASRCPPGSGYSWEALVRRGVLRGIPLDPSGIPVRDRPRRWRRRGVDGGRDFPHAQICRLGAAMTDATAAPGRAGCPRPRRRQLSQRLHPSSAARPSIVQPASSCPHCGYVLRWSDNVPVLSYAMLGGKCRQVPRADFDSLSDRRTRDDGDLRRALAGVWPDIILVPRLVFACALIVLFAIDLEHHLLPNVITLPGIVVGLAFSAHARRRGSSTR